MAEYLLKEARQIKLEEGPSVSSDLDKLLEVLGNEDDFMVED